jgi:hypothetical protein
MGFWHTGYFEFHEPVGLGNIKVPRAATVHRCEYCGATFSSLDALRLHRFEKHPVRRPLLYIGAREVGSTRLRITQPIRPSDVHTLHASTATVNGRSLAVADLGASLAMNSVGATQIVLEGETQATFSIVIDVATPNDLVGVEECFLDVARNRRLDRRAIEQVIEGSRRYPTASAYCDGICEYFYGVLIKEQSPEASLPFEKYREKFNRAAEVLADFDRPLARAIGGLIAFHFNHFDTASSRSPGSRVAQASDQMRAWVGGQTAVPANSSSGVRDRLDELLTDLGTERILRWISTPALSPEQVQEIESVVIGAIPETDRAKLRILLAEQYAQQGQAALAKRHARELLNNPSFDRWARGVVERVT